MLKFSTLREAESKAKKRLTIKLSIGFSLVLKMNTL